MVPFLIADHIMLSIIMHKHNIAKHRTLGFHRLSSSMADVHHRTHADLIVIVVLMLDYNNSIIVKTVA